MKKLVLMLIAGFVCSSFYSVALAGKAEAALSLPALAPKAMAKQLKFAQEDPKAFIEFALKNCNSTVSDYTCTFIKQEHVAVGMTREQKIQVKFREAPFSVFMKWIENPNLIDRVLYVEGQNKNLAMVKPAGILGLLVLGHINRPIDGKTAAKLSRKRLNQFGFANALGMITKVNDLATKNNELKIIYSGLGSVDGRPTLIFERFLPRKPCYPDQHLVFHVDREWVVPVALFSYDSRDRLLGKYIFANVKMNPGLSIKEFTAQANDL